MGRKRIVQELDYRSIKKYTFHPTDKEYKILRDKESVDYLMKWNLDKSLRILSYSYVDKFEDCNEEKLIVNLFQCGEVIQALNHPSLLEPEASHETSVTIEIEEVPCTALSMDFFDKIYDCGIVLADGSIRKCFEEYVDDVVVADELRHMLLVENSDNYSLFTEAERDEFIFRILKHLCIGGYLNQYEDNINPYLSMTKMLYKDIVCVRKTGTLKTIGVMSKVFEITCKKNGKRVIPSDKLNNQDFLYLVLNPISKDLTILNNVW